MTLRNQKVHHRIHNSLQPAPVLRQFSPFYAVLLYFLVTNFNIILPPTPGFPNGVFPAGLLTNTLYAHLLYLIRATCLAQIIFLDFSTRTIFGEQYKIIKLLVMQSSPFPVISSLLAQDIPLSTLFPKNHILCPSLIVAHQISHPHKTTVTSNLLFIIKVTHFATPKGKKNFLLQVQ